MGISRSLSLRYSSTSVKNAQKSRNLYFEKKNSQKLSGQCFVTVSLNAGNTEETSINYLPSHRIQGYDIIRDL